MKDGIDKYVGVWVNPDGVSLHIAKIHDSHATVSFCDASGEPIYRPYWNDRPSVDMPADYDGHMDEFIVDLWERDRGYSMHIGYHPCGRWDELDHEILYPTLSHYETDDFLAQYHHLFEGFGEFHKNKTQNQALHPTK
jgi:hypothetical protein